VKFRISNIDYDLEEYLHTPINSSFLPPLNLLLEVEVDLDEDLDEVLAEEISRVTGWTVLNFDYEEIRDD